MLYGRVKERRISIYFPEELVPEHWLALEILGKYHHRIHSTLNRPPIAVWSELAASTPLRMPRDRQEFLAGLLPFDWRLPRRDGIHLFGIRYWSDALVSLLVYSATTWESL